MSGAPGLPQDAGHGDSFVVRWLRLFGCCGLAVAQPVLDVLGGGPAFFITHEASRAELLLVLAAIVLVPATVLAMVVAAVRAWSSNAGERLQAIVIGLLIAITVTSGCNGARALPLLMYALVALTIAAAVAVAYARLGSVRTFATFLSPAPLLFAAAFLFVSPVSALVVEGGGRGPSSATGSGTATNVVMLVFDELPLGALMDRSGDIDAARFPAFAELAATSTWYPNATAVAPETTAAVPSLLTGVLPQAGAAGASVPLAAEHPRSVFTMLAGTHEVRAHEWVTRICPAELCADGAPTPASRAPSLLRDVAVISGHQVLPQEVARRWLPSISGQWAGFGDAGADSRSDGGGTGGSGNADPPSYERALADIGDDGDPFLWFVHERLPHRPPTRLPDGTTYTRSFEFDWMSNLREDATTAYRQQFLLQVRYVDHLLGQLLDRLEREGLADAMVIVTSDHGLSFQPVGHPRAIGNASLSELSDVLPIPLFVRYPAQVAGQVDDRSARSVDIVPTVADVLDAQLSADWDFDGVSLLDDPVVARPPFWQPIGELPEARADLDVLQFARDSHALFGSSGGPHDVYAMGPFGSLVGEVPRQGPNLGGAEVVPRSPLAYHDVDTGSGVLPALYEATVTGVEPGSWVAVAVDDVVAGLGMVLDVPDGIARIKIMLDPDLLTDGRRDLDVFVIEEDPVVLRPVAVSTDP